MSTKSALVVDPGNYTPYYDVNLCDALMAQGWGVEWLTSPYLFEPITVPPNVTVKHLFPRIGGIPLVRRSLKAFSYPFDLIRLDRELAARAPGVLHVQWALLPILDAWFWRRWQAKGWKIVYTAHDVDGLDGTTPRLLKAANRRLFRRADGVVTHSEYERAQVLRSVAAPGRVRRVPQGIPGLFRTDDVDRATARRELRIDGARPTVLFFGLLKAYKGLPVLLESLAKVRERLPNVLLMIVGAPVMSERECLRTIARLGLSDCVHRERSYIPSNRVGVYFAAADVVALPYRAASSSAVLLSAYSHARPVVATRVGGLPEMVEHGQTGLLVPRDAPAAFADALVELLANPERALAMGRRAREYALNQHNWSLIGRQTSEIYERL